MRGIINQCIRPGIGRSAEQRRRLPGAAPIFLGHDAPAGTRRNRGVPPRRRAELHANNAHVSPATHSLLSTRLPTRPTPVGPPQTPPSMRRMIRGPRTAGRSVGLWNIATQSPLSLRARQCMVIPITLAPTRIAPTITACDIVTNVAFCSAQPRRENYGNTTRSPITPQPNPRSRRTHLSARVPPPLPPHRDASRVTARIAASAHIPGVLICRGHRDCQEARQTRCFQEAHDGGRGAHSRRCGATGRVGRRGRRDGTDDARQCGGAVRPGDCHDKTERRAAPR